MAGACLRRLAAVGFLRARPVGATLAVISASSPRPVFGDAAPPWGILPSGGLD